VRPIEVVFAGTEKGKNVMDSYNDRSGFEIAFKKPELITINKLL